MWTAKEALETQPVGYLPPTGQWPPARTHHIDLLGGCDQGFLGLVEHGEQPIDNHRHDRDSQKHFDE